MALKNIVSNIKNYVKAVTRNQEFIELFDVDNQSVIFFNVTDANSIEAGIEAAPDGEFIFQDGTKIVISGGYVTSVEKPVEEETVETTVEETIDEAKAEETVETTVEETVEETVETPVEEDKDEKIAQLEAENRELLEQLEAQKQLVEEKEDELKEKEDELKEIESDLNEIKNFYTSINKAKAERTSEREKKHFCFIAK